MFRKVNVSERLPELGKFVTTIDEAGEHRVYRLTEYGWNMRDADGDNSPNNNLPIVYWLEEFDGSEMEKKAKHFETLGDKIAACYVDENGDELSEEASENIDLCTIGEIAASYYGWL